MKIQDGGCLHIEFRKMSNISGLDRNICTKFGEKMQHAIRRRSRDQQELSYRKQIARQLRTQFVEGISVTLKSTLRVTQGHWKRNHWTDHTRLTISRDIGR